MTWKDIEVECGECGAKCVCVTGKSIYNHKEQLQVVLDSLFWHCPECGAYVGTHKDGSGRPLGIPAGKEARDARIRAHAIFDAMVDAWTESGIAYSDARTAAYAWLGNVMSLPESKAHIGMLNARECEKLISLLERVRAPNSFKTEPGFGTCGCGAKNRVMLRRQNTAYVNPENNWLLVCESCLEEANEYWKERWEDYWAAILS